MWRTIAPAGEIRVTAPKQAILLLGGTGFIGTNLSHALVAAGHKVFVAARTTDHISSSAVRPVPFALDAVDELAALVRRERIDTVVHLVSGLKPSSGLPDYLAERDAVLTPTIRLARMLAETGTRLIYFSSGGTVYGAGVESLAAEDDSCAPISFYGQSKLETELHLRFLQRTCGLRALMLRPSNPYGPGQPLDGGQGLISVLLGRLRDGRTLDVWGDGSSTRDYIHIDDLVATVCALVAQDVHGLTLNIGSGDGHSLLDVVRIVEQVTGRRMPLNFLPARATDVPRLVLNVQRLREMGLHHNRPLVTGIRQYAASLGMIEG